MQNGCYFSWAMCILCRSILSFEMGKVALFIALAEVCVYLNERL